MSEIQNTFSISCHSNHHSSQHIFICPSIPHSAKLSNDAHHNSISIYQNQQTLKFINRLQQNTEFFFNHQPANILFPGKQKHKPWLRMQ